MPVSAQLVLPEVFPDDEDAGGAGLRVPGPERHGGMHQREAEDAPERSPEAPGELDEEARRLLRLMNARMGIQHIHRHTPRAEPEPPPEILVEILADHQDVRLTLVETSGEREVLAPGQTLLINNKAGEMPLGLQAVRVLQFGREQASVAMFRNGDRLAGELVSPLWIYGPEGRVERLDLSAVREVRVEPGEG